MVIIFIAIITAGTLISLISFIKSLKLTFWAAIKNPFFISQLLSFIGLCGLIFYGSDFLDKNHHQFSLVFETNLSSLLEAVAKVLWPILGCISVLYIAKKIFFILNNPQLYYNLARTIFVKGDAQSGMQNTAIEVSSIKSNSIKFTSGYHKEEYEDLEEKFNNLPHEGRLETLLDFATQNKIAANFESIFNVIFGTQISALKVLVNNTALDIRSFYDEYVMRKNKISPDSQLINYENWEKFLINNGLIIKEVKCCKNFF